MSMLMVSWTLSIYYYLVVSSWRHVRHESTMPMSTMIKEHSNAYWFRASGLSRNYSMLIRRIVGVRKFTYGLVFQWPQYHFCIIFRIWYYLIWWISGSRIRSSVLSTKSSKTKALVVPRASINIRLEWCGIPTICLSSAIRFRYRTTQLTKRFFAGLRKLRNLEARWVRWQWLGVNYRHHKDPLKLSTLMASAWPQFK